MILRKLIAAVRIYQIVGHFSEHLLTLLLFSISIKKDSFIKGHLFKSHLNTQSFLFLGISFGNVLDKNNPEDITTYKLG